MVEFQSFEKSDRMQIKWTYKYEVNCVEIKTWKILHINCCGIDGVFLTAAKCKRLINMKGKFKMQTTIIGRHLLKSYWIIYYGFCGASADKAIVESGSAQFLHWKSNHINSPRLVIYNQVVWLLFAEKCASKRGKMHKINTNTHTDTA